jgi:hypothetical protein
MTYRATRLLRLPGRTVRAGETVREDEVPPYRLGSYLRIGILTELQRKSKKSAAPQVIVEDEPAPESEEDET